MSELKIDWVGFGKAVLKDWPDGAGLDCFDVQDLAVKYGLLSKTVYDPEKHGECEYGSVAGDDWYVTAWNTRADNWQPNIGECPDQPLTIWVSNGPLKGTCHFDCHLAMDGQNIPAWFDDNGEYIAPDPWVSHWQPLPEPPKDE
jgi:hypothetical protein